MFFALLPVQVFRNPSSIEGKYLSLLSLERAQFPDPPSNSEKRPRWQITHSFQGPRSEIYFPAGRSDIRYILNVGVDGKKNVVAALTREVRVSETKARVDWVVDLTVNEYGAPPSYWASQIKSEGTLGMILKRRAFRPLKAYAPKVDRDIRAVKGLAGYVVISQVMGTANYWFVEDSGIDDPAEETGAYELFHAGCPISDQERAYLLKNPPRN